MKLEIRIAVWRCCCCCFFYFDYTRNKILSLKYKETRKTKKIAEIIENDNLEKSKKKEEEEKNMKLSIFLRRFLGKIEFF